MKCIVSIFLLVLFPLSVQAQFLKTGRSTYRSTDAKAVVVIVTTNDETAGLFIGYSPDATAGHDLHPKHLPSGTRSIFLHYKKEVNGYDKVILGKDQTYEINQSGSATFQVGALRASLDQDGKTSYLSLVTESGEPSILGLSGQEVLFNYTGGDAVSFLEANALHKDPMYRSLAAPYEVQEAPVLLVGNKPYLSEKIGIGIEVSNDCYFMKHTLVTPERLENLKKGEREQATRYVRDELEKAKRERNWENLHILNLAPSRIVSYDFQHNDVLVIERKDVVNKTPVCIYSRSEFVG